MKKRKGKKKKNVSTKYMVQISTKIKIIYNKKEGK